MSNIQKAFKNKAKCGLRMATGGFFDTVQEATPTSMFSGPGGSVGASYSGASSPMRQNQRSSGFDVGNTGEPLGTKRLQQPLQPTSLLNGLDNKIIMNNAMSGLSNMQRQMLANPENKAYKATSVAPGSAAEASQLRQQNEILRTLRDNVAAQQPQAFADSGVVPAKETAEQLMARMAAKYGTTGAAQAASSAPAPAPTPAPQAQKPSGGVIGVIKDRNAQLKKVMDENFANGGILDTIKEKITGEKEPPPPPPSKTIGIRGLRDEAPQYFAKSGVVQGEGTRTSDSVPAVVGEGEDQQKLALSKGEGLLVVSNNTMDNPVAMDQIRQILADSNGGKEPKMPDQGLRAGVKKAANSGFFAEPRGYMGQVDEVKRGLVGPPAPTGPALITGDDARALKAKVVNGDFISSIDRADKSPQEISQGSVGNTFVADGAKPGLRSGAISNMQADQNTRYGTTMVDATEMQAPNGGGYITGTPQYANGLRRAIELAAPGERWEDGQQYKDAIARNAKDKALLAEMQRDRIKRTAAMPGATHGDMVALATQIKDDENATQTARFNAELGLRGQELGLRRDQLNFQNANIIADNRRADATARRAESDKFGEKVDKLIESWATVDGKVDGTRYANLQKYAANIPRGVVKEADGSVRQQNDKEYLQEIMDQYTVDSLFEDQGRHAFTIEKPWSGEAVRYKREGQQGLSAIFDGALPGQESFVDPATNRRIYARDALKNLSPNQLRLFKERAINQG